MACVVPDVRFEKPLAVLSEVNLFLPPFLLYVVIHLEILGVGGTYGSFQQEMESSR